MASGGTSDVNLNVRYGRVQIAARARENAMNEARNEVKLVGKQPGFSATNAKTSRNEAPSPSKTTTMRPINRISTPTSRLPSNVQQQQRQQASKSISTYQRQLMDQLKLETRVQAAIPNRILDEEREEETNPKEIYAQVNSHREARLGVDRESDEGNENHNHCHHHHHHHPHAQQTRPAESHNQQLNLNQHKPHCVHHNPSCLKHPVHQNHLHLHHQHQHQNHNHHHNHLRSNSNHLLSPAPTTRGPFVEGPHKWRSLHPNIKPPDYPYLLVEYRTPGEGLQAASTPSATMEDDVGDRGGNGSKRRRSTVGFISQLYFLLHLSAIISLLLHHNSLVSSERKHQMYRNSLGTADSFSDFTGQPNESSHHPLGSMPPSIVMMPPLPTYEQEHRPLPVPQILSMAPSDHQVVNSYLPNGDALSSQVSSTTKHTNHQRVARTLNYLNYVPGQQADLLVRLVGWWHAKHALQYLLCYLLSSSIIILVGLWLLRLCKRTSRSGYNLKTTSALVSGGSNRHHQNRSYINQIPYHRTRLADCTPVLIGSISLGLIQLIVVGLDIASNIDWLTNTFSARGGVSGFVGNGEQNNHQHATRWPVYLPFLHFTFVSLLMQFILAQVAKNHELEDKLAVEQQKQRQESGASRPPHLIPSTGGGGGSIATATDFAYQRRRKLAALSINNTTNHLSLSAATASTDNEFRLTASSPISNGLQNIALAHLLVTHILLWLMKLNSISLFQPIEHQQQYQFQLYSQHRNNHQSGHSRQLPPNLQLPGPPSAPQQPTVSLPPGLHKISARNNSSQPPGRPMDLADTEADNHQHSIHPKSPSANEPPTLATTSTEFKSNDRLLRAPVSPSSPPPPLDQPLDDASYEKERQRNRSKLESMLRPRVPRIEHHVTSIVIPKARSFSPSTSLPPPILSTGEPTTSAPITPSTIATSNAPLPTTAHTPRVYQSAGSETGVSVAHDFVQGGPVKVVAPQEHHSPPILSVSQTSSSSSGGGGATSNQTAGSNQRGHRSTARGLPVPVGPRSSQQLEGGNSTTNDPDWKNRTEDGVGKNQNGENSTAVIMTRTELANLINSVKQQNNAKVATTQAPQLSQVSQANQQQGGLNLTTTYKSSLPKRMTAFRQSIRPKIFTSLPPATVSTTTTTTVTPATIDHSTTPRTQHQRSPTSTMSPMVPSYAPGHTSSSTTTTSAPVPKVKQKAKILISRKENDDNEENRNDKPEVDVSLVIPTRDKQDSDRTSRYLMSIKAKNNKTEPRDLPSTTERPFPSVESEPPEDERGDGEREQNRPPPPPPNTQNKRPPTRSTSTTSTTRLPTSTASTRSPQGFANYESVTSTMRPPEREIIITRDPEDVPSPAPPIGSDTSSTSSNGEDDDNGENSDEEGGDSSSPENGGEGEESEIDLDALLPPVPNYTDTEETPASGKHRDSGRFNDTSQFQVGNKSVTNPLSSLDEEEFVFNEAASTSAPSFVATIKLKIGGSSRDSDPRSERLVASASDQKYQQNKRQDGAEPQPTFAEYLLPIVHQYHILIIAILFHMWLDSLYRQRRLDLGKQVVVSAARRHHELLTETTGGGLKLAAGQHRNARRLIAIPIGPNGKPKLKTETNQLLGNNKHFISSQQVARLARDSDHRGLTRHLQNLHHRSKSMDYLSSRLMNAPEESNGSTSGLSRHNSLRSSSSEQLLWVEGNQSRGRSSDKRHSRFSPRSYNSDSCQTTPDSAASDSRLSSGSFAKLVAAAGRDFHQKQRTNDRLRALQIEQSVERSKSSSACSVFLGLLIVSASLIVMLLGIDLLSLVTQCLTQILSILACLLGLYVVWRHRRRFHHKPTKLAREFGSSGRRINGWTKRKLKSTEMAQSELESESSIIGAQQQLDSGNHRQVFHYLFLLAAYYCGLATALNLGNQNATEQQLFTRQVMQFVQRHWTGQQSSINLLQEPVNHINYTLLFHLVVALKGLILVVQVTLQTVLIRLSSWRESKCELRQIYTFLMFANLSLWAMDICEQQQHLQEVQHHNNHVLASGAEYIKQFELLTLNGFTRFASSIVTLSHLYHGLVFMQQ